MKEIEKSDNGFLLCSTCDDFYPERCGEIVEGRFYCDDCMDAEEDAEVL